MYSLTPNTQLAKIEGSESVPKFFSDFRLSENLKQYILQLEVSIFLS